MHIPRVLISATRGGAGKSLLSLGLARACARMGLCVSPCKKGPDYIDAAWLSRASGSVCTNLDPFFLDAPRLRALVCHVWQRPAVPCPWPPLADALSATSATSATSADAPHRIGVASCPTAGASFTSEPPAQGGERLLLIEGNRGLFDGRDVSGSCSSAELAKILDTPVVLSLDITKMTRTSAALVAGLAHFDPQVRVAGVVLNQCASARHESLVRSAIERYTDIPVLGALPRFARNPLPERHMGLPALDDPHAAEAVLETLAAAVREHVDIMRVLELARATPALEAQCDFWASPDAIPPAPHHAPDRPETADTPPTVGVTHRTGDTHPRIGYVRDAVLWFYYQENLEALERSGATLVPLSLLDTTPWPEDLRGVYLGGGFPEEWGESLRSSPHFDTLRRFSQTNMPIYAECGGFMLLAQSIVRAGQSYPMCGIFPVQAHFHPRPQGLGYVEGTVTRTNPFHPIGMTLRGHEFHYSRCEASDVALQACTLQLSPGTGMGQGRDGLCVRNTFAAYTHIYAPAAPHWAPAFVACAARYSA